MSKHSFIKVATPKELEDIAYEALQIARDTGKIRRGTNEATKAIERGVAKLVYVAEDVEPPEIVAHIPFLCEERKICFIIVTSKGKLGSSCGLSVPTAAACIIDPGDGSELITEIIAKIDTMKKS